jgi:hypothetical protein
VGEAATICIAAIWKDWRGRMWTNELTVVHHSSFVEEEEGRSLDSFVLVLTYEGTAELKINEEGDQSTGWRGSVSSWRWRAEVGWE